MLPSMLVRLAVTGLLVAWTPPSVGAKRLDVASVDSQLDEDHQERPTATGFARDHGHAAMGMVLPGSTRATSLQGSAWSVEVEPPSGSDPWSGGEDPSTGAGRQEGSRPVSTEPTSYDTTPRESAPAPTSQPMSSQPATNPGNDQGGSYEHASNPNDTIVAAGRRGRRRAGRDTLFGDGEEGFGVHFDVSLKGTAVDRKGGLMMGTGFGAIIADRLELGLRWHWLVTPQFTEIGVRRLNFDFNYGGFHLGVFAVRRGFFRLMLGGVVGGGSACLDDERLDRCYAKASLFAGEPEVTAIFSVLKFMRITLGGGYRFVQPQRWSGPSGSELGGATGTFAIQLGAFDQVGRKGKFRW